jgi:hypothetical protein
VREQAGFDGAMEIQMSDDLYLHEDHLNILFDKIKRFVTARAEGFLNTDRNAGVNINANVNSG